MLDQTKSKNIYYPPGGILLWIIIFLELITFGMALIAFAFSAKESPEMFHQSRLQLNTIIGSINTIFLLSSGFFMVNAVHQFKKKNIKGTSLLLNLTMLGGFLFIILKSLEYYFKIKNNLLIDTNTFFTFYWLLTLFHLIHVVVGLVILIITSYNIRKANSTTTTEDVESSAAFWHMCDLIWLLIFPILYLIP